MDPQPKTRKESRKSAKDKAYGKDTCYSSKHIRQTEALLASSGKNNTHNPKNK